MIGYERFPVTERETKNAEEEDERTEAARGEETRSKQPSRWLKVITHGEKNQKDFSRVSSFYLSLGAQITA